MKQRYFLIIALIIILVGVCWFLFKPADIGVTNDSKPLVTVSLPLLRSLVAEIGGDELEVESIIDGPSCSHEYEPASGDLINVSRSAVFVKVGLGFDIWADKLAKKAGEKVLLIDASHGVGVIKDKDNEYGSHDEHEAHEGHEAHGPEEDHTAVEDHHHHELGNPHYWGDPENVKIMAGNILAGLSKAFPEREAVFTCNYQAYLAKLDRTVADLKTKVNLLSNKQLLSYSAAFPYFYRSFGLKNLETVETTCEQEVSPKRLAEVIAKAKAERVKVVVGDAIYPKLPENLAKEIGAKVVLLWPATNETGDYLETLTENVTKLVTALQ
jgi:zinc transport system substrate-binding protein